MSVGGTWSPSVKSGTGTMGEGEGKGWPTKEGKAGGRWTLSGQRKTPQA
jgi:hypothetical protein